jgi:tetratricopeptide (TPR) repeat protein
MSKTVNSKSKKVYSDKIRVILTEIELLELDIKTSDSHLKRLELAKILGDIGDYDFQLYIENSKTAAASASRSAIAHPIINTNEHLNSLNNIAIHYMYVLTIAESKECIGKKGSRELVEKYKEKLKIIHKNILSIIKPGISDKEINDIIGTHNKFYVNTLNNIATVYFFQGKDAEAIILNKEAVEIQKEINPDHPDLAGFMLDIGLYFREQGKINEAFEQVDEALEIGIKNVKDRSPELFEKICGHYIDLAFAFSKEKFCSHDIEAAKQCMQKMGIIADLSRDNSIKCKAYVFLASFYQNNIKDEEKGAFYASKLFECYESYPTSLYGRELMAEASMEVVGE